MKLKALCRCVGAWGIVPEGAVFDVPPLTARRLIAEGKAEPVKVKASTPRKRRSRKAPR